MLETDLHQPGHGTLRAAAEVAELTQAARGLTSAYGYRLADCGPLAALAYDIARSMTGTALPVCRCASQDRGCRSGGVWLVTGRRRETEAGR